MTLDELAAASAAVLTERVGSQVALVLPEVLKDETRCCVVRFTVVPESGDGAGKRTVIVKQIRRDPARGFSDWASLAFLAELPGAKGLVPEFLGGDVGHSLFLLADLGGTRSLENVLRGNDPAVAMASLRELALQMARLQAATMMDETHFTVIREALPESDSLGRFAEAEQWLAAEPKIASWFSATDVAVPAGFSDALHRIADTYASPGPFLAFTHGDPAPTNNHIAVDGQVRLLDFEYGGFRHALYDITGWNVLCPLPSPVIAEMGRTFRQELGRSCAAARDDHLYADAWGHLCAYRGLAILSWIPPVVLQENRAWASADWTARHAVLAALSRIRTATTDVPSLAPVSAVTDQLLSALRARWTKFTGSDEAIVPAWRALAALM